MTAPIRHLRRVEPEPARPIPTPDDILNTAEAIRSRATMLAAYTARHMPEHARARVRTLRAELEALCADLEGLGL